MPTMGVRVVRGSIAVKLTAVLLVLGGAAAAAVTTAIVVFASLSDSVEETVENVLPRIEASNVVIQLAGDTSNAVANLKAANSDEERAAAYAVFEGSVQNLENDIRALPSSDAGTGLPLVSQLRSQVADMNTALTRTFALNANMIAQTQELQDMSDRLDSELTWQGIQALNALKSEGRQTNETVLQALEDITGREVARLRLLLNTRADLNLVIGAGIALTGAPDPTQAIIAELGASGLENVRQQIASLSEDPHFEGELGAITEAYNRAELVLQRGGNVSTSAIRDLVALRDRADGWLLERIEALRAGLVTLGDEISERNRGAIDALLEIQVRRAVSTKALDIAFKRVVVAALLAGAATDVEALAAVEVELGNLVGAFLEELETGGFSEAMAERLRVVDGIMDPQTGIPAERRAYLEEVSNAEGLVGAAQASTDRIAEFARDVGARSAEDIRSAGAAVVAFAADARERLWMLSGAIALAGLGAFAAAWMFIARPVRRLTKETERLSRGDLSPIDGLDRLGGEIGQMARAVEVFRSGMIEREDMIENERRREAEQRAKDARQEQARCEEERLAAEREAKRLAEEKELKDQARERERQAERAAQKEREARTREQEIVVDELADGMLRLSQGDLTVAIDREFPGAYEAVRQNFNEAVSTLADLIRRLSDSASQVDNSAQDMAATAHDMATRTERTAKALERTSAAILELDATAKSTSKAANEVTSVMQDARVQAETSQNTVTDAVATMSDIEKSSNAISKIVDMIEEIAFQTNLLALNAGVEAARAGDEGRGFGVVASEVRALAQRSSNAASEINGLITATRDHISRGVKQVGDAGEALNGILELIADISSHVSGIAGAAKEQATTISEISASVHGIEEQTQRNSAVFEESLAASEQLRSEAKTLSSLSENFCTKSAQPGPAKRDRTAA